MTTTLFSISLTRKTTFIIVFITVILSLGVVSGKAHAAPVTDFNAGHIIDDAIFTDNGSMDTSGIQNFLNSKVASCDTDGTQSAGDMGYPNITHAQYAANRGWPGPPYTCLKNYSENGLSASQIIYNVSQQYKINPQVLIVLLQKEQGLVTDTWPLPSQYRTATGYGCPDTAACDSQYFGLTNQLTWSGKMFRAIMNNSPTWYTPYVLGQNYIQYSPDASCGGSTVNIENRSTQALYNYTPYQPNQAALDSGYGTVNCGAYGNRNFFLYFRDWFGSTRTSSYHWAPVSQSAYTDSTQATDADLNSYIANTSRRLFLTIKVLNNGSVTWNRNSVNLGTSGPRDRKSNIYDQTWLSPSRPATLTEASVTPGQYGTFSFWINTPTQAGNYKEYFNLLTEGVTWMNDMGLYYELNIQPAKYTWDSVSQQAFTDNTKQTQANLLSMVAGDTAYMSVKVRNTGNVTWQRNAVNFGTAGTYDRISTLKTSTWASGNRAATLQEQTVAPGGTGTFEFPIRIPAAGTYKEYFNLVAEGIRWMNDIGFYYQYNASPANYTWQPLTQAAFTNQDKSTPVDTNVLTAGQRVFLEIKAKNTGNATWYQGNLNLATNGPRNRSSSYYDSTWMSTNRPATLQESSVSPGQTGTFGFWVKAPTTPGTSKEYFNFVAEYAAWLNDLGLYYQFTVH